ncbi:MAG: Tol-Pal system beta propeller repeat protein TolB [Nitrospirae bacterium]|nr:Tol-Pal system beta propeller repeat protein TolB [Nitrospirota bacterium]
MFVFKFLIYFFTGFLIVKAAPAFSSDVHIEIQRTESPRTPLGVLGFQSDPGLEKEAKALREVLLADLKRSLSFQLIDLSNVQSASTLPADFVKKIAEDHVEIILSGRVKIEGDQLHLDVALYNGKTGKWLWERDFKNFVKYIRMISHRSADQIIYQLTGEEGIAETAIAYVSDAGGSKEIYRMDYDGFNPQRVTLNHTINLLPRWSPDGKKLSYTSYIDRNPDVWITDMTTTKRWKVTSGGLNLSPVWFPNGNRILFAGSVEGQTQLFTATEEGKNIQRLSFSQGNDLSPSFSPTGHEVVFNSDRGGTPQLYVMNSDGTNVRRLTFEGDYNTTPSWSPKGDWIAYTCRFENRLHICLISPDGQKKVSLSSNSYDDESPVWAPDSKHLAFSSNRGGKQNIYMMTSEGTEVEKLTQVNGNFINPAWSPLPR